jgi:GT2 family glycosyltransferase
MNRKPLVSTVMIFLNEERFLPDAIASVLAQTYQNWELLLVDDGSTDGSTNVALRYAEQCAKKVRYLEHNEHSNRGRVLPATWASATLKASILRFWTQMTSGYRTNWTARSRF